MTHLKFNNFFIAFSYIKKRYKKVVILFTVLLICLAVFLYISVSFSEELVRVYNNNESAIIKDRFDKIISIKKNDKDFYNKYIHSINKDFSNLLILKEDKYFYYHFGFNPVSISRAIIRKFSGNTNFASSTITQQLVKILLNNEEERTMKNKLKEFFYSISLEINNTKEDILLMYINSIYFGNQVQGIDLASLLYFEKTSNNLTTEEIYKLLATIESPSTLNPFTEKNINKAKFIASSLGENIIIKDFDEKIINQKRRFFSNYITDDLDFESNFFIDKCQKDCSLTLDRDLSSDIREVLEKNLSLLGDRNVNNGSVVVIKIPENEIVSIIGSANPNQYNKSSQINMALKPRPIGSTLKPFIYLQSFIKGLRPYSLVDDKEYRYVIDSGYAFYPKNYDYKYNGIVNLHYALSNSLNVPAVKVLEYVGIKEFIEFIKKDLEIPEEQSFEGYGLGLALGQLEMDLLNLSYLFTLFPNDGYLKPLKINSFPDELPSNLLLDKKIAENKYIELVNKILSDRNTSIDQFGLRSSLNFLSGDIALKTGTSREFHDSFVIGYTPDFLVAVWLGNADNTPMDEVSGQTGAGVVFQEVMNLMINSQYNKNSKFKFNKIVPYQSDRSLGIMYGLKNDNYKYIESILLDEKIVMYPHNLDVFLLQDDFKIPIKCSVECEMYVNEELVFTGLEGFFHPIKEGDYNLKAVTNDKEYEIKIVINK